MQGRQIEINDRPTFQLIKLIEILITSSNVILNDKWNKKSLTPVRKALDSLARTIQDGDGKLGVRPALKAYEEARTKQLGTSDTLDKEYERAVKDKLKVDEIFNNLPKQHELDLARQKELRNTTVEDIAKEQLDAIGEVANDTAERIVKSEQQAARISTLQNELNKLITKISSNCCGAEMCNKKDKARVRNLEFEIKVLEAQQEIIRSLSEKPVRDNNKREKLEKKLADEKAKIDQLIDTYDERRKKAQRNVDKAAKALSVVQSKIMQDLLDQCRVVDRDTMYNLIHLRARVENFYSQMEVVYKADSSSRAVLDAILSAKAECIKQVDEVLGSIYYPALDGKSGHELYLAYTDWAKTHQKEQQEIESAEFSPNEYINNVIPEVKQEVTKQLRTSTLGTVHDFFPSSERSRRRSAERADTSSATPSMRASSSTTS